MREALSAKSGEFQSAIAVWLDQHGEVLVLVRLSRAAGNKDWYLLHSLDDLATVITRCRPSDCLTAFAGLYLPHRGRASEQLLASALDLVMSVEESVFGEQQPGDPELLGAIEAEQGDQAWVADWFEERRGRPVAFGEYPPFLSDDTTIAVDGIVPNVDGSVSRGVY